MGSLVEYINDGEMDIKLTLHNIHNANFIKSTNFIINVELCLF